MKVSVMALPGVLLIETRVFDDARGYLIESWSKERYRSAGITDDFVQDNLSMSSRGVLRGLHLQNPYGQGKLVMTLQGSVYDVAVDVRPDSRHFGRWCGAELSAERSNQMYVPPGFAHGFCVLSERALFAYKCTAPYAREAEIGIAWDDPDIGIDWPIDEPVLSEKDAHLPRLAEIAAERLPRVHVT